MMYKSNFYVLTGGPGAGKTTVLRALQSMGYLCVPEVARTVIREQISFDGEALPWKNTDQYSGLMLAGSVQDYRERQDVSATCFFDRGIPDTLAYNRLTGLDDAEALAAASAYRYNPTVFLFPPWEEIYRTDKERKQDFKQAVDTYHQIAATYKELGYEVMQVPFLSVEGRVDYICSVFICNKA